MTSPSAATSTPPTPTPPAPPELSGPELPKLPVITEMKFVHERKAIWVHSPAGHASLGERASSLKKTATSKKNASVTVDWEFNGSCALDFTQVYSQARLQSRIENTRALRLHLDGKFREAARGFARAAKLDPDNHRARTNYIAALSRLAALSPPAAASHHGALELATAQFHRSFKIDAVGTYEKLLADDDWAALRKTVRRPYETKTPLLRLQKQKLVGFGVAYSADQNAIAVIREETSWGSMNWMAELHVFDADTNKRLSLHPVVNWRDTEEDGGIRPMRRKQVEAHLERLSEVLTVLGFVPAPASRDAAFDRLPGRSAHEAKLKDFSYSIVADNDQLRVVQGNKVAATFTSKLKRATPSLVYALPEAKKLVYLGYYEVSEGCDSGPETRIELIDTDVLAVPTR